MKRIHAAIYVGLLLVMASATIIEKYHGTDYVSTNIYGSWWFSLLWAFGVAAGIFCFIRHKAYKRHFVLTLHLSFVIILIGALLTHLTARRGSVCLQEGLTVTEYTDTDGKMHELGLSMKLNHFDVIYHAGTEAPKDYISTITINGDRQVRVSMNKIYRHGATRFYQADFSPDHHSSILAINSDPYGIPVTYTGYALLFLSLIWILFARNGEYRQIVRSMRKPSLVMLLFVSPLSMHAQHALSPESAKEFSKIYIVYNDRICPMETFAIDFTKKLYGKSSYKEFSATQVLSGFMFWGDDWMAEPILRIKRGPLQSRFNLKEHISPASLFGKEGYLLGPYLQESDNDKFHNEIYDLDDILLLIMQVQQMTAIKVFPFTTDNSEIKWFSTTAALARQGNDKAVKELFHEIRIYQYRLGKKSLPSLLQLRAEGIYNHVPFATILFILNLTVAILAICLMMRRRVYRFVIPTAYAILALSFLALSFGLTLRWIISGTIPMNNGYETTIVIAWVIMLVALLTAHYMNLMTIFGLLMSGFILLVSHINQMNPAITHRVPILNSPLLSIHVSVIMMAYALLSLTFIISLTSFIAPLPESLQPRDKVNARANDRDWISRFATARGLSRQRSPSSLDDYAECSRVSIRSINSQSEGLGERLFSLLLLYPAITLLGIGIFVGAIWANISWGTYWSWDSKEVWALITFMIYAVPLHAKSIPAMNKPKVYHCYMLLAFLTVLMTYFGVNYFLTGMHSYAN